MFLLSSEGGEMADQKSARNRCAAGSFRVAILDDGDGVRSVIECVFEPEGNLLRTVESTHGSGVVRQLIDGSVADSEPMIKELIWGFLEMKG